MTGSTTSSPIISDNMVQPAVSGWSPFHYRAFTIIWIGTVVSNIGGWMSAAASGWLMTSLNSSPIIVAMIQERKDGRREVLILAGRQRLLLNP